MGKKTVKIKKVAVCVRECRFGGSFCLYGVAVAGLVLLWSISCPLSFHPPCRIDSKVDLSSSSVGKRIGPMKVGIHPMSVMNC